MKKQWDASSDTFPYCSLLCSLPRCISMQPTCSRRLEFLRIKSRMLSSARGAVNWSHPLPVWDSYCSADMQAVLTGRSPLITNFRFTSPCIPGKHFAAQQSGRAQLSCPEGLTGQYSMSESCLGGSKWKLCLWSMLTVIFVYPQHLWLNICDYNQSHYLSRQLWMQPQRLRRTAAEESIAFSFLSCSRGQYSCHKLWLAGCALQSVLSLSEGYWSLQTLAVCDNKLPPWPMHLSRASDTLGPGFLILLSKIYIQNEKQT